MTVAWLTVRGKIQGPDDELAQCAMIERIMGLRLGMVVLILTGCVADPAAHHHYSTHYVTGHPLNCGTPDEFKICPLPRRPAVIREYLPLMVIEPGDDPPPSPDR
jgi:hypothetical protein